MPTASQVDRTLSSIRKTFRTFSQVTHETTPFMLQRCNTKKLVVFLKRFHLQLGSSKEEECPRCLGSLLKLGGSCDHFQEKAVRFGEQAVVS